MVNCDLNLILSVLAASGSVVAVYLFLKGGIEKMIKNHTNILHTDIIGIKEDIKELREDSKRSNERMDRLYQMFVDLLNKDCSKMKTDL